MQLSLVVFLLAATTAQLVSAAAKPALDRQFETTVKPFMKKYCTGCHGGKSPAAQFDLTSYDTLDQVTKEYPRWSLVAERLHAKDMPPKPMAPPPAEESRRVIEWFHAVRNEQMRKFAGDPGLVSARRLSNAEYNYTIRDLTGHDLRVTREFPIDPANPAGFDNSGESLAMSPALLNKYLEAARQVANHMVLSPDSMAFASHPMIAETDREKYAIQRIMDFYLRQPTKLADYFAAAWRYKYRAALGKTSSTLASIAADANISPKYLATVWDLLNEREAIGPILKLQTMWRELPAPAAAKQSTSLMAKCGEMEAFVTRIRKHTAMQFAAPRVRGLPAGSQPLLHWKNREFAAHRREFDPKSLRNDTDPPPVIAQIPKYPGLHQEAAPRWAAVIAKARAEDPDLVVPAAERQRYEAAFTRFASVFPDAFVVTERGRYFPDDSQDKGRLLNAGYHSVLGFFRDDTPLMELILDDKGRKEIDRLWVEFDYIASYTARTWEQYFFNQSGEVQGRGAESGTARPVGREITDEKVIMDMRDAYLAKAAADPSNDPISARAIREHFDGINATLRGLEKMRLEAEPKHLDALVRFAARAYRRPLTKPESDDFIAYYRSVRKASQLTHEEAVREGVVSILMSPDFLYRIDLQSSAEPKNKPATTTAKAVPTEPLSDHALASRLSYFLWATAPDDELLKLAAAGTLRRPEVLLAQTRRMLKDPRVRGFATEFTGNWLGFRQFETNNAVDRERFPTFNNELREAMFLEPIQFIQNALLEDRSVLDLLYADYTYVNPVLAQHYGVPEIKGNANTWTRVDGASRYGRGGLLPMAVFLTQNSPGLRTSPVKRGNWVVQRVLGEVVPPPPPSVPELPDDESKTELPVREMLAKHRENALCSACHARIDSFGLPFEGYGPVGNMRTKDLAGRPVDTLVTYPGGKTATGLEGLKAFIRDHRQSDFVANVSRKLLAYALNRSLQLSDEPLVERMQIRAASDAYRFSSFVQAIVTSPQFLNKRASDAPATSRVQSTTKKAKS
jgi:hypothetical protein